MSSRYLLGAGFAFVAIFGAGGVSGAGIVYTGTGMITEGAKPPDALFLFFAELWIIGLDSAIGHKITRLREPLVNGTSASKCGGASLTTLNPDLANI